MQASNYKLFLVLALITLQGCYSSINSPEYLTATRTTAPQPVYNRVFLARPPEVLPTSKISNKGSQRVEPVYQLQASSETVENVAKQLAKACRYRSYTAASVADKKITVETLGTVDELADTIGREAGVYVSVDHANRELRVLPPRKPRN